MITELSAYAAQFRQGNDNWCETAEYNVMFLRMQQNYLNDKLRVRGHVFLNDVFDLLGVKRTSVGAIVGWLANTNIGDGFIDFGIFSDTIQGPETPQTLYEQISEGCVNLVFNCDGVIYDKI